LEAACGDLEALPPEAESVEAAAPRLRSAIEAEREPRLIALRDAARARGVTFLTDEDQTSVGLGAGSVTWPTDDLPAPEDVDWQAVHDVPVVLVTGTNGKTTTVRLLCSIARAAGLIPGSTSTDGIVVGDRIVDADDWAGPGGARQVLRIHDVELGILETARGGILRRGLGVPRSDASLVTNVAADHLGEYGVEDVPSLADAKLVVARVVRAEGRVVLNAEDEQVVEAAERARGLGLIRAPTTWFSANGDLPIIARHLAGGGDACTADGGELVLWRSGRRVAAIGVDRVPITLGGAARFNVRNALAALGVATALGLPVEAIAAGLEALQGSPADNPGRLNLFQLDGVNVLVDFAHNPHGMAALVEVADSLPAQRRLIVLGQAGDRDDESIRGLARAAWEAEPDLVVIKEMSKYLRGRDEGVVPALIESELREIGAPAEAVLRAESEIEAVRTVLARAAPGDLILLTAHSDRDEVLDLLSGLQERGRAAGDRRD
jgi:cyanophycin synthetase